MRNKIRIILLAVIIIALVVVLLLFLGTNKNYNAPYLDITYSSRNDQLACLTFYKNGKYRWLFKEEIHNKKDYGACYQDFYYMSKFKELTQRRINLELVRGYIVHLERIQESKRRCYIYSPEASKYDEEIKEYSDAILEILTGNQFKKAMSLYKDYYLKCNNYLRALA